MNRRFFSIVIPAHNEEKLISQTLSHLVDLDYPKDRYEVIVIENNSNDNTYDNAKKFESDTFKIISTKEKGVSRARNMGIRMCSDKLDWCLIMDADTYIKKDFLKQLNDFIDHNPGYSYGTTTLTPDIITAKSKFWFGYRNITDRILKILHVIHIVKKDILFKEKYDEELGITEDMRYGRSLSKHGKYFFMETDQIITSARRFEQKGYLKMFFINIYIGLLPRGILIKKDWGTIR